MRTPAILVSFFIINYLIQQFFELLGLDGIANIFSSAVILAVIALGVWIYSRCSGNLSDAADLIDQTVDWIHEAFISPHAAQFGGLAGAIQRANQMQNANQ